MPRNSETPPRAWGRLALQSTHLDRLGNTPTCVGKTGVVTTAMRPTWKHPHVRGEDAWSADHVALWAETPPRAWGRHQMGGEYLFGDGNTPTCVGKTHRIQGRSKALRKHPHVRGEDDAWAATWGIRQETPPRAWGRLAVGVTAGATPRNTPTCVGKTWRQRQRPVHWRKHPHVRGEDSDRRRVQGERTETPPRAWGRRGIARRCAAIDGNTPTCVGKTYQEGHTSEPTWKHPHVRGEDTLMGLGVTLAKETPPRAWGRLKRGNITSARFRNTPTCVGKTIARLRAGTWGRKHPHVRGEDSSWVARMRS